MKVVLCEVGKQARITDIDGRLEGMQKVVGGMIEATYPSETDPIALICNEEGKIYNLPANRAILKSDVEPESHSIDILDIISGTFFICGIGEENFDSLSDELAEKYLERFRYPERFYQVFNEDGPEAIRAPYTGEE